jgi:hypothetical protein
MYAMKSCNRLIHPASFAGKLEYEMVNMQQEFLKCQKWRRGRGSISEINKILLVGLTENQPGLLYK